MLTPTDIHLLVGLLSQIASPGDVEVELGAQVADRASGTARDVDVTILAKGAAGTVVGLAGTEVKAHARKLDVTTVEQLCQKLKDMPTLTSRAIVSASGFTGPAKAKALSHGIELLSLRPWGRSGVRILPHVHEDFHADFRERRFSWVGQPQISFISDRKPVAAVTLDLPVLGGDGSPIPDYPDIRTLVTKLVHHALGVIAADATMQHLRPGELRRTVTNTNLNDRPVVMLAGERVVLTRAEIMLLIMVRQRQLSCELKVLVREKDESPYIACAVGELSSKDLLGIAFAAGDQNLHVLSLPVSERNRRKIRRLSLPKRQVHEL